MISGALNADLNTAYLLKPPEVMVGCVGVAGGDDSGVAAAGGAAINVACAAAGVGEGDEVAATEVSAGAGAATGAIRVAWAASGVGDGDGAGAGTGAGAGCGVWSSEGMWLSPGFSTWNAVPCSRSSLARLWSRKYLTVRALAGEFCAISRPISSASGELLMIVGLMNTINSLCVES